MQVIDLVITNDVIRRTNHKSNRLAPGDSSLRVVRSLSTRKNVTYYKFSLFTDVGCETVFSLFYSKGDNWWQATVIHPFLLSLATSLASTPAAGFKSETFSF